MKETPPVRRRLIHHWSWVRWLALAPLLAIGWAGAASQSAGQILWRDSNGTVSLWFVNGGTITSSSNLGVIPAAWTIQGRGDFNGDGQPDILWRNANGDVEIWFMNGGHIASTVDLGVISTAWTIQGTGDFNGDGKTDILWRNANGDVVVWFMNGGTIGSSADLGVVPAAWTIQGTGDFNGDGKADILWRNVNGDVVTWLMNGGTIASAPDFGVIASSWTIQGTGDFNGDGKTDILWRNTTGDTVVWFMNGGTIGSSADYGAIPAVWTIQGTGDFNGDGKTDILWRNANGDVMSWLMNGNAIASSADFGVITTDWTPALAPTPAPVAYADVVTYHDDNLRTGQYLSETTLTPANVTAAHFGLLRKLPVDGKVDAQPLVLTSFTVGGVLRDVVYAATEHDSVYAFDANTGAQLWKVTLLGSGETPSDARNCNQVVPEIGVTATPVIDRAAGKIFLVAMSKDSSGGYHHRLHALNLTSGAELSGSPVNITATLTATGPAPQGGTLSLDAGQYKERSALLLSGGVIYTSWASHCDIEPYSSWLLAYDETLLQQSAVFNAEPNWPQGGSQGEGAFWNANSGPSADAGGNIYAMNGNGNFDTTMTAAKFPQYGDFGDSILKLSPPSNHTMTVLDYFTMYNTEYEQSVDSDLGSGGLMLLPDEVDASHATRHLAVGAGKDKQIYVVDRDNLGKFNAANNSNAYQDLTAPFGSSTSCGQVGGVFSAPVYFNHTVYYVAAQDVIRAFPLAAARLPTTAASTTSHAYCFPGGNMAISANGAVNGILWVSESTTGVLHAYDATNLASELYNSSQSGTRDAFGPGSKFTPPAVANGKVYVATGADITAGGQNYVAVFGLL